jgi:hypothetical protein
MSLYRCPAEQSVSGLTERDVITTGATYLWEIPCLSLRRITIVRWSLWALTCISPVLLPRLLLRISFSGLLLFRINYEIVNLVDSA